MATKPLRPCRYPGCCALVSGGYCGAHQPRRGPDRSEAAQAWHRLYSTPEWQKDLRPNQLLAQPFCEECLKLGRRVRATDVDHRVDHRGDWAVFADRSSLQSLCHSCHSRKTARELWRNRAEKQWR